MTLLDSIIEYPEVFDREHIQKLYYNIALYSSAWGFQRTYSTGDLSDTDLMLKLSLKKDGEIANTLLPIIENRTKMKFKVRSVHMNGQFFGMDGAPHTDETFQDAFTFLVYVNPIWKDEWGGKTIFFDKYQVQEIDPLTGKSVLKDVTNSEDFKEFTPKPNLGLLFPSHILHYGDAPTKECKNLRVTLAFKLLKVS